MVNLYPLFNYIQQEENIYFLKKDEEEKKDELNFLFQSQNEAIQLEGIDSFLRNNRSVKTELSNKIISLGEASSTSTTPTFQSLFPNQKFLFDQEEPFIDTPVSNLNPLYEKNIAELDDLISFLGKFDVEEYKKLKRRQGLNAVVQNRNLLLAFILQSFISENSISELNLSRNRNKALKNYSDRVKQYEFDTDILETLNLSSNFINDFAVALNSFKALEADIGEVGQITASLLEAREKATQQFLILVPKNKNDEAANCPLCNSPFSSLNELLDQIESKTQALKEFNLQKITEFEQLRDSINSLYIALIDRHIEESLLDLKNIFFHDFYSAVMQIKGNQDIITRFNAFLDRERVDLQRFVITQQVTGDELQNRVETFRNYLIDAISLINVNEDRVSGVNNFKTYFNEDEEELKRVSIDDFILKKEYVAKKYSDARFFSLNQLNLRLQRVTHLEAKVEKVCKTFDRSIKTCKMGMIERIKMPFYIISGRILQHFQQGHGIFIDMQETTNRVRFLTENKSDHDIIHQLSSGQLAVVSIACCLALNKVYNTNYNFKFLAIDDPVQTMDDINIHSFIEVMRHEFQGYQIVISTHEENVANYMSYKFQKFGFDCNRLRVQNLFYAAN